MGEFNEFSSQEKAFLEEHQAALRGSQTSTWYKLPEGEFSNLGNSSLVSATCPETAGYKLASDYIRCRTRAYNMRKRKRGDFFAFAYIQAYSKKLQLESYERTVSEFIGDASSATV